MKKLLAGISIVAVSVIVILSANMYKGSKALRCEYDGTPVIPVYEVVVNMKDGNSHVFCSVNCARAWINEKRDEVVSVYATDEVTGEKVDASIAYFVKSRIVTVKETHNIIHVFKYKADAVSHAEKHDGRIIENPLSIIK